MNHLADEFLGDQISQRADPCRMAAQPGPGKGRAWIGRRKHATHEPLIVAEVPLAGLSLIMRALIRIGGPRSLQGLRTLLQLAWTYMNWLLNTICIR
jgi:hypothetical protein